MSEIMNVCSQCGDWLEEELEVVNNEPWCKDCIRQLEEWWMGVKDKEVKDIT